MPTAAPQAVELPIGEMTCAARTEEKLNKLARTLRHGEIGHTGFIRVLGWLLSTRQDPIPSDTTGLPG